jgi:amino acid transporter
MNNVVIDVKTLAMANLAVQILLIMTVFGAVYLARNKKLVKHCTIIQIAVPVQIIAILLVMLPSMMGFIENVPPLPFFYPEMLIHHSLGLVVVGLWVYINLGIERRVRMPRNRAAVMWLALGAWIASLLLGLSIYFTLYT